MSSNQSDSKTQMTHISHETPPRTLPIPPSQSDSPEGWTDQGTKDKLFEKVMQEDWDDVISMYTVKKGIVWIAKITRNKETALHIAISDSKTEVVKKLLDIIDPVKIRDMINDMGENPLHLAGQAEACKQLVEKYPELIGARNKEGETPLFKSALHGKEKAFYALHPKCPITTGKDIKHDIVHCKRTDGDSILHVAIQGEYFRLAYQIIYWYPELIKYYNEKGLTALHLLAQNPSAFRSGCHMGPFDDFIYRCLIVDLDKVKTPSHFRDELCLDFDFSVPENYQTCMDFLKLWMYIFYTIAPWSRKIFNKDVEKQLPLSSTGKDKKQAPEEPRQDKTAKDCKRSHIDIEGKDKKQAPEEPSQDKIAEDSSNGCKQSHIDIEVVGDEIKKKEEGSQEEKKDSKKLHKKDDSTEQPRYPSKYIVFFLFVELVMEFLLFVLGLGYFPIHKIKAKKQRHKLACQIMKKIVYSTESWAYMGSGSAPITVDRSIVADSLLTEPPVDASKHSREVAAKMGIVEMVAEVLNTFPVALYDEDSNKKNVLMLSAENGQRHVVDLLREKYPHENSIYRKLDNKGNTAIHLAATFGKNRPWRISSAAIQMQWDLKWFNFIKSSMPTNSRTVRNRERKTSMEVFEETHEGMIKDGVKWLNSTSESCSVIAALIAAVAYASATTVPGGYNQNSGIPIFKGDRSFDTFITASLVALCFSVTSLTMFLSVLTSNYMIEDFLYNLPTKLLLGLTSLFISIGAMLVSFCAGHFFNIGDRNRNTGSSVFAIICLPVSAYVLTQFRLLISLVNAPF